MRLAHLPGLAGIVLLVACGNGTTTPSSTVADADGDGVPDATDVCVDTPNPDQADLDSDGEGDLCDPDIDGDGAANDADNCPLVENASQTDGDGDAVGDVCDVCPTRYDPTQDDANGNGTGDLCDDDVIDDGTNLYVPAGTTYEKGGTACYTGAVVIDGTLLVAPWVDGDAVSGALQVQAPHVLVSATGRVDALAAGAAGGEPSPNPSVGGLAGAGTGGSCAGGPGQTVGQAGTGASHAGEGGGLSLNGYASECDACSEPSTPHCEGAVGTTYGAEASFEVLVGSGGGAAGNSAGCTLAGGRGGGGGGAVGLYASEALRVDGEIDARGETPPPAVAAKSCVDYRAGGGGGSGGAVLLSAPSYVVNGTVLAGGGDGGDTLGSTDDGTWGWSGGGGGGGRIKLFGTGSAPGVVDVAGGLGGGIALLDDASSIVGDAGEEGSVTRDDSVVVSLNCP